MIMPSRIDKIMFAPCGMNCMVCYKHCMSRKACEGCLAGDLNKPEHCRRCKIKDCVKEKDITYCYECLEFPCKSIKSLDKSYKTRYCTSLNSNSTVVSENGIDYFMESELKKWTCTNCGGVVSLHDAECSECKEKTKYTSEK